MPLTNPEFCFRITSVLASLVFTMSVSTLASPDDGFTMQVMDAFTIAGRGTVLTGKVKSGSIVVGDPVCIPLNNGETAARVVNGIEMFRKILERAEEGQMVGLLLQVEKDQVDKGAMLHSNCEPEGDLEQLDKSAE